MQGNSDTNENRTTRTLQSIKRTFDVIDLLGAESNLGLTELANRTDIPKSTVYIHLQTLKDCGIVIQDGDKYRLSFQFLFYGGKLRYELPIYQQGSEPVKELANETGELVNLGIEENGLGYVIYMSKGVNAAVDLSPMGKHSYLHQPAYGKAILAHLPKKRVEEIIDTHGLPSCTEYTVSDHESLFKQLRKTRERGYAIEYNEGQIGLSCIGSSIKTENGSPLGAVSVSLPTTKLKNQNKEEEIAQKLLSTINIIELNINNE